MTREVLAFEGVETVTLSIDQLVKNMCCLRCLKSMPFFTRSLRKLTVRGFKSCCSFLEYVGFRLSTLNTSLMMSLRRPRYLRRTLD